MGPAPMERGAFTLRIFVGGDSGSINSGWSLTITTSTAPPLDFGDAPDSYGTTLANNGARHSAVSTGPILGALRDTEMDGQPSAGANGDDLNGATINYTQAPTTYSFNSLSPGPARRCPWQTIRSAAPAYWLYL